MPIAPNNTRVSIDFQWEYELDGRSIPYSLKFIHTENGPMLHISPEGYGEYIELPAVMFLEVANFLQSQGVFGKSVKLAAAEIVSNNVAAAPPQINANLLPIIKKNNSKLNQSNTVDPTATITHLTSQQTTPTTPPEPKMSEDEIANIAKQRIAAKAKANTAKKVKKSE